jgi:hypothetical protein
MSKRPRKSFQFRRSPHSIAPRRVRPQLERLESRELLDAGFGSLVQVAGPTPFTNTGDINGQSGTVYLNAEVEPQLAVDPNNPQHLVGVYQQDRWSNGGSRGIVSAVSTDGGNTWTNTPLPGVTVNSGGSFLRASDPWVSIGPNGTVYAASLEINDPTHGYLDGFVVNTSTDGGKTWSNPAPVILNSNGAFTNDKDSITADPITANYAYVVWDRLNSGGDPTQGPGPTLFSRTTDGGQTWSAPQDILDPAGGQTLSNQIAVLPNGTLVNMCVRFNSNGTQDIVVIRSSDHGSTWSAPTVVNSLTPVGVSDPDTGAGVRTGDVIPDIAVDHNNGNLYVVWQDGRFSGFTHDDIAFSMSTDGGMTWSAPVKVNQTPTNLPAADEQAFTGTVAVNASGEVAVTYNDFRNNTPAPGALTDYWIAFANPAQQPVTFGNEQRLTNTSFDMELAPNANGYFLGDYEALIAGGQSVNTFGAFFSQTVSSQDPANLFFRGAFAPGQLTITQLTPPAATEGQAVQGTVATFTDPSANLNNLSAVVTWGDGNTDTRTVANGGIVQNANGSFSVVAGHTYAEEASALSFSVQVSDGNASASSAATLSVTDAALTGAAQTITAQEAKAVTSVTVATFTDADPNGTAADYSATINWGDGDTSSSIKVVADANVAGQFDVVASKSHPYADGGNFTVAVTIKDAGGSSSSVNSTAAVTDAALTPTGKTVKATEGTAFNGVIATFTDANPNDPATAYTAVIHWGDGNTSNATIVRTGRGVFNVDGSNNYADEGTYSVAVNISDAGGASTVATSTAAVTDAKLIATGTTIQPTAGTPFTGTVATFTDANSLASASDFSATIAWGDHTSSAGTVVASGSGFAVQGTHTYASPVRYTLTITITDGSHTVLTNSTANVAKPGGAPNPGGTPVRKGHPSHGVVPSLPSANPASANGIIAIPAMDNRAATVGPPQSGVAGQTATIDPPTGAFAISVNLTDADNPSGTVKKKR